MLQIFVNLMGWGSILLLSGIAIYTATLKWVAQDEGSDLPWRHALWYALNDVFFWARRLGVIEDPRVEAESPLATSKTPDEKKPVRS